MKTKSKNNLTGRPSRAVLRYYGGKYRLADWIISHFPPHRSYLEPYCGAASVLLAKPRSRAECVNDRDDNIVSLFQVLRDKKQAEQLRELLTLTPFARAEFYRAYEPSGDPVEAARRLIVRSFMGFGSSAVLRQRCSGFRAKLYNSHTTGADDWKNYPAAIPQFCQRLQGVIIENRPALDLIRQHGRAGSLIYADPPYLHATRALGDNSTRYSHEMTDDDHCQLAATLHQTQAFVVLSGYDSPLYNELYGGWPCRRKVTTADGAGKRIETLWISPLAAAWMPMQFHFDEQE